MFFDPKAALEEIQKRQRTPATSATLDTPNPKKVAKVAKVAGVQPQIPKTAINNQPFKNSDMRHGRAVNGYPKTWTGKIVSPDVWHELTEWERHGPDGRLWCGACREWVTECAHTVR